MQALDKDQLMDEPVEEEQERRRLQAIEAEQAAEAIRLQEQARRDIAKKNHENAQKIQQAGEQALKRFLPTYLVLQTDPNSGVVNDISEATLREYCILTASILEDFLNHNFRFSAEKSLQIKEALFRDTVNHYRQISEWSPDFIYSISKFIDRRKQQILNEAQKKHLPFVQVADAWIEDNLTLKPVDTLTVPDIFNRTFGIAALEERTVWYYDHIRPRPTPRSNSTESSIPTRPEIPKPLDQTQLLEEEARLARAEFGPIFDLFRESPNSVISNDIHQATLHEFCAAAAVSLEKHLGLKINDPENKLRLQEALYRWAVSNNKEIRKQHPDFLIGAYRFVNQTLQSINEIQRELNITLRDAKLRWMEKNLQLKDFDEIVLPDSFLTKHGHRDLDRPTETANFSDKMKFWSKKLPKFGVAGAAAVIFGGTFLGYSLDDFNRAKPIQMTRDQVNIDEEVQVDVLNDGTCEIQDIEIHNGKRIRFTSNKPVRLTYVEDRLWPRADTAVEINSQSSSNVDVRFKVPENNPGMFSKKRWLSCETPNGASSSRSEIRTIRAER